MQKTRPILCRVCFVTGTRAEFGLMRSTLRAIAAHPSLELQLIVTGMHLSRAHGRSLDAIRRDGWKVDAVVPWARGADESANAVATGKAIASLAGVFARLKPDIVLVTGDRVEAFAGAATGHIGGKLVAHVHGGDRALGLVDDSLRHAITKLAHIHFPATRQSARRIERMGEDRRRIFRVGSPGLDGVRKEAASRDELSASFDGLRPRRYALVVLHPQSSEAGSEKAAAELVLAAVRSIGFERIVIVHPNNDPGAGGISGVWNHLTPDPAIDIRLDIPRPQFLGLLRYAAVLVGNSSSGIIEAASFGTPVLDIGTRQTGRERGRNVTHVEMGSEAIRRELRRIYNGGKPVRFTSHNVYGGGATGEKIAEVLATITPGEFREKIIAY
jgi:UDP-hydrolysing UDP-N-acetyl-D-glucosamine 2-epimerase